MEEVDEVLRAIQEKRTRLEKDVEAKRAALEEAEARLSAFRANALSALGAASGSKSAQKQRAERQTVVAQMMADGLSRAEIVRRTGLVDHLVGYDIDCIRRRRKKQGTQKVFASLPKSACAPIIDDKPAELDDGLEDFVEPKAPSSSDEVDDEADDAADDEVDDDDESEGESEDIPESGTDKKVSVSPPSSQEKRELLPKTSVPGKPEYIPKGASASRDQLKALAKSIQRAGGKTCRLFTTVDNGHRHIIVLDLMGDGETTKDSSGHKHRACRFEMLESDHLHGITVDGIN
jgi:hypothetical protein